MLRKKQVITIVSITLVSFLVGTMFNVVTGDSGNPWDRVWEAIERIQGLVADMELRVENLEWWADTHEQAIDELNSVMQGLIYSVGAHEDAIDDLQSRVGALEEQSLPQGFMNAPAFDSGWILSDATTVTLYHNLGTEDLLVYLIGREGLTEPVTGNTQSGSQYQMAWSNLNTTHIDVYGRYGCKYVRVMIWRVQEPPT